MKLKLFFISIIFLLLNIIPQTIVPIATLHNNNSQGVPIDTGQFFMVEGIVTSSNHFGTAGPGSIQDASGGISIYGNTFANVVKIGDSVKVYAKLSQFNGLTQLDMRFTGTSVTKIDSNKIAEPVVVTISQINSQQWNGFEDLESELIRINNVTIQATGNFAGGTNYNISDATGTSQLRIDNDVVSIIGTPIPSGQVDLIGILGQYKFGPPYNSGYQILPRFIQDIVDDGKPIILNPVYTSLVDSNSFTVFFNTSRKGNSQVKYGLTTNLELDSVIINEDTTFHKLKISGLQSSTLYYFKAYSKNNVGTSVSSLQTVRTASNNPQSGTINIYFNNTIDQSVAIPNNIAKSGINFANKLIERINSAVFSIDLALYSFSGLTDVANAIISAKNRGVKIRVVYDSRDNQNSMQLLINAGIKISKRPSSLSGIMHNKFFIFDARDSIINNDWLWTGSWNATSLELNWKNNVLEINDAGLASAYMTEFEEMWGSNNEEPNPANAKFGYQKIDNTPHTFTIGGREINLYFSPSDQTNSKLINSINTSDKSVYLAQYAITRNDLRIAIQNRFNAGANDCKGVIDQINISGSEFNALKQFADVWQNYSSTGTLHHKYAIIDASYPNSLPTTITGSHNWSTSAETDNDENTLIIKDIYIANQFMQEFKKRYNEAGGTGTFVIPTVDINENKIQNFSVQLFQNYPNPFNPITTIRVEVPNQQKIKLELFDILGSKVATLFEENVKAGIVSIDFNANSFGRNLSSGIYIYKLTTDKFSISKKLVLMK